MNLGGFLSLGGTEIANDIRTLKYIRQACIPGWQSPANCACASYSGTYVSPAADPAPWYTAGDSRSADFKGLILDSVKLLSPFSRNVTKRGTVGSSLGPLQLGHRVIACEGALVASTCDGMSYGERWLDEALRGQLCGSCQGDDLCVAVNCSSTGIRMMRNAGLVDGPVIDDYGDHECTVQRVGFQLVSELPYLYRDPAVIQNAANLASGGAALQVAVTTNEWVSDAAMRFVFAAGNTSATAITLTGRVALTPFTCPDTRVPACFAITIASLPANSTLTIDATSQQVIYHDPITLQDRSGLFLLSFAGQFDWPVVPPCTSMCWTATNAGAQAVTYTAEKYDREI